MDKKIEKRKALRNKVIFWGVTLLIFITPFLLTGKTFVESLSDIGYGITFLLGFAGPFVFFAIVIVFFIIGLSSKSNKNLDSEKAVATEEETHKHHDDVKESPHVKERLNLWPVIIIFAVGMLVAIISSLLK